MQLGAKLGQIRKQLQLSQAQVARLANFSPSYITMFENSKRPISNETLKILKTALDIENVPLTEDELLQFKDDLLQWQVNLMNYFSPDEITRFHSFEKAISFIDDPELITDFKFAKLTFLNTSRKLVAYNALLVELQADQLEMSIFHKKELFFHLGINELYNRNYRGAMIHLKQAEKLSQNLAKKYLYNLVNIYYNLATAYTGMRQPMQAYHYFDLTESTFESSVDMIYISMIQSSRALLMGVSGLKEPAVKLLKQGINQSLQTQNSEFIVASRHSQLAKVYLHHLDLKNAMHHFKEADELFLGVVNKIKSSNMDEIQLFLKRYTGFQLENKFYYMKTCALSNQAHQTEILLEEGLRDCAKDSPAYYLFKCFEIFRQPILEDDFDFIENVAIPKLLEYGYYNDVLDLYKELTLIYENKFLRKKALYFSNKTVELLEAIRGGEV